MTDLPARLRDLAETLQYDACRLPITAAADCLRAAEEIERLTQELNELRAYKTAEFHYCGPNCDLLEKP